ncbi:MAG: hypothetical protein ABIW80_07870, partial [Lapillicoccus sp.]
TRLDTIDTDVKSISGQLAGDELSTKLGVMNTWNNSMRSLYMEYFLPIGSAAKDVSVAKKNIADATTPVPTALTDALAASTKILGDRKADFKNAFDLANPYTVFADQHDELYPRDPNVFSVLKLAGSSMESKGYATWADSQRLSSLYLTLSDQEALSALLILEHDKMFGADAGVQQRHKDEYVNNHAIEQTNLAPEIPWDQVKVGDHIYRADVDYDPAARQSLSQIPEPWLPISPEGKQLGSWDAARLLSLPSNAGWDLPTDTQLTALYDGTKNVPAAAGSTHLGSIWTNTGRSADDELYAKWDWNEPWLWSKDTSASNPMTCTVAQSHDVVRVYTLHHVGHMGGATAIGIQGQPGRIPDNNYLANTDADCDRILISNYDNDTYAASVVMTRAVDADKEDFMAQRSTALPPPATPTGTATTGS